MLFRSNRTLCSPKVKGSLFVSRFFERLDLEGRRVALAFERNLNLGPFAVASGASLLLLPARFHQHPPPVFLVTPFEQCHLLLFSEAPECIHHHFQ